MYTIALIVHQLQAKKRKINFIKIWNEQNIHAEFQKDIYIVAEEVNAQIDTPQPGFSYNNEFAKRELCWNKIKDVDFFLEGNISDYTISFEEERVQVSVERQETRITRTLENEIEVTKYIPYIEKIALLTAQKKWASPKNTSAMTKLKRNNINLTKPEINAFLYLIKRLDDEGLDYKS